MIQLPPSEFTFGKYGLDIPFKIRMDDELLIDWMLEHEIIGFCASEVIPVRPSIGEIVIMVEIDDWQAWTHITERQWNKYLKKLKG